MEVLQCCIGETTAVPHIYNIYEYLKIVSMVLYFAAVVT